QEMAGLSTSHAAVMVGGLGIFNGFGRLLWATVSDYIGRPLTFSILLLVNLFFSLLLLLFTYSVLFVVAMSILMTCYGAGFSLIPDYLSDIFGTKELAALHGYIL
nr:MFS transporter [Streptococcus mitis]